MASSSRSDLEVKTRERQDILALCEEVNLIRRNEPQRAWHLALSAAKRAQKLRDEEMIAESNLAEARCLEAQGKFGEALEIVLKLNKYFTKHGQIKRRFHSINMLGLLYYRIGDYKQALANLHKATQYFEKHADKTSLVMSLNLMGNSYKELADYQRAIECYFRSLRLAEELQNQRGAGVALNNIGNAYYRMGEIEKAREHYEKSLAVRTAMNDAYGQAVTLGNLGNIFEIEENYSAALECQEHSLAIRRQLQDLNGQATVLANIAKIYIAEGKHIQAEEFLLEARDLCERSHNGAKMAFVLCKLGNVYTELERGDEALRVLNTSLDISEKAGMLTQEIDTHRSLAETHARLNNYEKAFQHLTRHNALLESQRSHEQSKTIADLQLRYELENAEKEKEIYRLRNVDLLHANREILAQKEQLEQQAVEIENANARLTQQNKALSTLNDEKNDILGIAAHDLKNPLSSIALLGRGISQSENVNADNREMASDIVGLAASMIELIENLLEINSIENGRIVLSPENFSMKSLLDNVIRVQTAALENKNLSLTMQSAANDDRLFADCMRTRQILDNLVSNAIKYSEPGSEITIRVLSEETTVTVEVEDEGPGISDADKKRLFKKFQRLSARPTMGEHSTGLGLSIVKLLCDSMQGSVTCSSKLGVGSCFRLSLPRNIAKAGAARKSGLTTTSILTE